MCVINTCVSHTVSSSSKDLYLCPQCLKLSKCSINVCERKELREGRSEGREGPSPSLLVVKGGREL